MDICRASLKIETCVTKYIFYVLSKCAEFKLQNCISVFVSEELRPAIRLSTCLSPEEEKELRNKKNLKDEELSLHNEL